MSLTQGLGLPFGVQPVNPVLVDSWAGPYSSVTEANANIPSAIRLQTRFVHIIDSSDGNKGKLFWYKDGISDTNLVYFSTIDTLSALGPIQYNSSTGVFSITQSNGTTDGYLSSADWNTFNNKQTALGYTPENVANKGVAGGYAPLDNTGKLSATYLPSSILGQVHYVGTWNPSTNTPTLPDPTTVQGAYYIATASGTYNSLDFNIGDWVISDGTNWDKVDNTDAISSFNGRTGAITLVSSDVTTALGYTPVSTTGSYSDPLWITALAWSKITGAPAFITSAAISTLTDVTLTSLTTGNFLRYNGSAWLNTLLTSGDIPSLDMSKITTGNLDWLRISSTPTTLSGYGISSTDTLFDSKYAPSSGSSYYIQNTTTQQVSSNFNISGNGIIAGYLLVNTSSNPSSYRLNVNGTSNITASTGGTYDGLVITGLASTNYGYGGIQAAGSGFKITAASNIILDAGGSFGSVSFTKSGTTMVTVSQSTYVLDVTGTGRYTGNLTANSFIKSGGTSSQFLKADGSVDSNTYLTSGTGVSSFNTRTGAVTLSSTDVTTALGFTPYNSSNPNGYISSASVSTLTDASITSVANGQLLQYNSTSGKWVNWTPNYISGNQTITLGGILSGSGTTSITASAASGYYMPTTTDQSNWNGKQTAYTNLTSIGSLANGAGVLYNNGTGTFSYTTTPTLTGTNFSGIPNSALVNSSITIQGTSVSLGGSVNPINGTGFVKASGTTISYDNSTYLTTSSAAATYQPLEDQRLSTSNNVAFASLHISGYIGLGGIYPQVIFTSTTGGINRILYNGGGSNDLVWRYDGTNDATILNTFNYNSYAPTLTGTGASGTWGINITGNSGTANALNGYNGANLIYWGWTGSQLEAKVDGTNFGANIPINITGTSNNITAYTINQNLGTSNSPTFAGGTYNGTLVVNANVATKGSSAGFEIYRRDNSAYVGTLYSSAGDLTLDLYNVGAALNFTANTGGATFISTLTTGNDIYVRKNSAQYANIIMTDNTLGSSYGGQIRGYGVAGRGGWLGLGTYSNGVYTEDITISEANTGITINPPTTFNSSVTASSFYGAGTGLTGTASGLTAGYSNGIGSTPYNGSASASSVGGIFVYDNTNAQWRTAQQSAIQSWLGLGSNAYTSTAYLPLSGGTLTNTGVALSIKNNSSLSGLNFQQDASGNGFITASQSNSNIYFQTSPGGSSSVAGLFQYDKTLILYGALSGTSATFSSSVTSAALYSTGIIQAGNGVGYVQLNIGGSGNSGYLSFWSNAGNRQGYIGYSNTNNSTDGGTIPYVAGTHAFTGNITSTGSVTATGFFESSDIRLKNILNSYQTKSFGVVDYTWKDGRDTKQHVGYIAQEVQKFLPSAVMKDYKGFLTVNYHEAHAYKIRELELRVQVLEEKLKKYES